MSQTIKAIAQVFSFTTQIGDTRACKDFIIVHNRHYEQHPGGHYGASVTCMAEGSRGRAWFDMSVTLKKS